MRKFILKYNDNSISIVTVYDDSSNEEIISKSATYQQAISYRDISDEDIPNEYRDFRDAWEDSQEGPQIDISHSKARDIALVELTAKRDTEISRLQEMKANADIFGLLQSVIDSIDDDLSELASCTQQLEDMNVDGYSNEYKLDEIRAKSQLPTLTN